MRNKRRKRVLVGFDDGSIQMVKFSNHRDLILFLENAPKLESVHFLGWWPNRFPTAGLYAKYFYEVLVSLNANRVERAAKLAAFSLPGALRSKVFDPAIEEIREDFAAYRDRYESRGAHAFLSACFIFKIILLYLDCLRVWGLDKFIWLIPPAIRMLWRKP